MTRFLKMIVKKDLTTTISETSFSFDDFKIKYDSTKKNTDSCKYIKL
jgi:hypothetical protein